MHLLLMVSVSLALGHEGIVPRAWSPEEVGIRCIALVSVIASIDWIRRLAGRGPTRHSATIGLCILMALLLSALVIPSIGR